MRCIGVDVSGALLLLLPHLRKPVVVVCVVVLQVREEGMKADVSKAILVVGRQEPFLRHLEHLLGFDELLLSSLAQGVLGHLVRVDTLRTLYTVSLYNGGSRSSLEANLQAEAGGAFVCDVDVCRSRLLGR